MRFVTEEHAVEQADGADKVRDGEMGAALAAHPQCSTDVGRNGERGDGV
jgi:hypothetical protein